MQATCGFLAHTKEGRIPAQLEEKTAQEKSAAQKRKGYGIREPTLKSEGPRGCHKG